MVRKDLLEVGVAEICCIQTWGVRSRDRWRGYMAEGAGGDDA